MNTRRIPDGLDTIRGDLALILKIIARTAQWVHPETFKALPVWCPDTARGFPRYDARWRRVLATGRGVPKKEENIRAASAFIEALGVTSPKPRNWTVCHIWGYDDDNFADKSAIVQDPRFYSCIANMIWLPTPLKGFTDAVREVKQCLRVCAFNLYGWVCEHEDREDGAREVRSGKAPDGYPEEWPTAERRILPPGTAPYNERVRSSIARRKAKIFRELRDRSLEHYPRDKVREVLKFWNVNSDGA